MKSMYLADISIHSAARAETNINFAFKASSPDFNPLRREGGDSLDRIIITYPVHFNPLRREGGDLPNDREKRNKWYFNPLRREGGDAMWLSTLRKRGRFQSTPPRGRRPSRGLI